MTLINDEEIPHDSPAKTDSLEELLGRLDPKTQKRIQFASNVHVKKFPVASVGLTHALGGGIGAGRLFLIYGPQSSGKSLFAGQTIADFQKAGLTTALLDVEKAYDPKFGARMGIDNSKLLFYSHQAVDKVTAEGVKFIKAGVDLLVVDSISDIISDAFLDKDGELNDVEGLKQIGAQAKAIRKMIDSFQYYNENTAIILISQTTTDLSGLYAIQVPHGGKKVLFKCSQIVRLFASAQEKSQIMGTVLDGDRLIQAPIGRPVTAYVEKNKLGRQSTKCDYNVFYAGDYIGIDRFAEGVALAIEVGAIETTSVGRYAFDDLKWHGLAAVVDALRNDPELKKRVMDRMHLIQTGEIVE